MIPNTFSLLNLKCWPRFHQTSLWYPPLTCFSPPEVSKTGQAGCFKIEVAKNIQSKRKNSLTCLLKMIKKRLGDILPHWQNAPRQNAPRTFCPKTFCPKSHKILEGGHIAPTVELWWTFCPTFERLWATFEKLLRDFWETFERLLSNFWETFERLLRDFRETFERLLRDFWEITTLVDNSRH